MVTVASFCSSIKAMGLPNDIAAANHHGVLASEVFHANDLEHLHAAVGRAGFEAEASTISAPALAT